MIKTVSIYTDIEDVEKFQKTYMEEIMPKVLELPGVIKMNVTSLIMQNPEDQPEKLRGVQFIIETYYESLEVVHEIAYSSTGQELLQLLSDKFKGHMGGFFGKEYSIQSTPRMDKK